MSEGSPCYYQCVFLTKEHEFGPVNVMAYWDREDKEVRYVATSRHACKFTLNWGKRRSWIDATFKDFKTGGFQLESSKLTDLDRMDRLLLVMCITYLWCYHVNLLGEVITPKFDFPYNLHGIDFLKNKLQSACDISHAKKFFLVSSCSLCLSVFVFFL